MGNDLQSSGRQRAKLWSYPRHEAFESKLRERVARYFNKKGYPVQKKYPFILKERKSWPSNIILQEVVDYINAEKDLRAKQRIGFPLHKYLHHGLSSQALLFNLIGPLIIRNDFAAIIRLIANKSIDWPQGKITAHFEVEDRQVFNENYGQPTSIDLEVNNDSGPTLFIEAKFAESEFGGCSVFNRGDCDGRNPLDRLHFCYLHHIGRKYWDLMDKHEILTNEWKNSPICPLSCYYQFYRELLFATHKKGYFILLHDERSPTFFCKGQDGKRGIFAFLVSMLPESLKSNIIDISIQEMFQAISMSGKHYDWTSEFSEKYGMACKESILPP